MIAHSQAREFWCDAYCSRNSDLDCRTWRVGKQKLISVATAKPNIIPGIAPDWFWDNTMFLAVSKILDQIVPMLY
jgi:hypothetical protein